MGNSCSQNPGYMGVPGCHQTELDTAVGRVHMTSEISKDTFSGECYSRNTLCALAGLALQSLDGGVTVSRGDCQKVIHQVVRVKGDPRSFLSPRMVRNGRPE